MKNLLPRVMGNYLRVRGEYTPNYTHRPNPKELPPRARRIPVSVTCDIIHPGTTSACAENTAENDPLSQPKWNYLRVRGEYSFGMMRRAIGLELPPRARRIPNDGVFTSPINGTTSACAENTCHPWVAKNHDRNYLRVRGEYGAPGHMEVTHMELPPRARRIPNEMTTTFTRDRTTSACAENTLPWCMLWRISWNYLRVRGEYGVTTVVGGCGWELPPRARRIRQLPRFFLSENGTTSACAENTKPSPLSLRLPGNYLRVRGEYNTSVG